MRDRADVQCNMTLREETGFEIMACYFKSDSSNLTFFHTY